MKKKEFKTAKRCYNYLIELANEKKIDTSLYPTINDNVIICHSKIVPATSYGEIKRICNFKFPACEGFYTLEFEKKLVFMAKKSIKPNKNKKLALTSKGYAPMKPMNKITWEDFSVFDVEDDLSQGEDGYKIINEEEHDNNISVIKHDGNSDLNTVVNDIPEEKEALFEIKKQLNNKHCGSISNFDRYLSMYENSKSEFLVISYGVTRKLMYGKYSFIFNGLKGEIKPKGTHLINLLKKDLDKLLLGTYNPETDTYENKLKPLKIPEKKPFLTFIHHKNLDWFGIGQEALAIDINHCYWRTIYLLGRITEETYNKGIEKSEYKDGRLIAVGTLGKILTVKKYKDGIKIGEYIDDRDYKKYGGFFWEVICKVYTLLVELWQTLKEDFLMFLTDCVVIDPCKKDLVVSIMEKHGYGCKEYKIVFTKITEDRVAWVTDKGEPKYIIHNRMLNRINNNSDNKNEDNNHNNIVRANKFSDSDDGGIGVGGIGTRIIPESNRQNNVNYFLKAKNIGNKPKH